MVKFSKVELFKNWSIFSENKIIQIMKSWKNSPLLEKELIWNKLQQILNIYLFCLLKQK